MEIDEQPIDPGYMVSQGMFEEYLVNFSVREL